MPPINQINLNYIQLQNCYAFQPVVETSEDDQINNDVAVSNSFSSFVRCFNNAWNRNTEDVNSLDYLSALGRKKWTIAWTEARDICNFRCPEDRLKIIEVALDAAKAAKGAAKKIWEASVLRTTVNTERLENDLMFVGKGWEELDVCSATIERDACKLMIESAAKAVNVSNVVLVAISGVFSKLNESNVVDTKEHAIVAEELWNKALDAWEAAWDVMNTMVEQKKNTLRPNMYGVIAQASFEDTISKFKAIWERVTLDKHSLDYRNTQGREVWIEAWNAVKKSYNVECSNNKDKIICLVIDASKAAKKAAKEAWDISNLRTVANIGRAENKLKFPKATWEEIDIYVALREGDACKQIAEKAASVMTAANTALSVLSEEMVFLSQAVCSSKIASKQTAIELGEQSLLCAKKIEKITDEIWNKTSKAWEKAWDTLIAITNNRKNAIYENSRRGENNCRYALYQFISIWKSATEEVGSSNYFSDSGKKAWVAAWNNAKSRHIIALSCPSLTEIAIESSKVAKKAAEELWKMNIACTTANIERIEKEMFSWADWGDRDIQSLALEKAGCDEMVERAVSAIISANTALAVSQEESFVIWEASLASDAAGDAFGASGIDALNGVEDRRAKKAMKVTIKVVEITWNKAFEAWEAAWNAMVIVRKLNSHTLCSKSELLSPINSSNSSYKRVAESERSQPFKRRRL